MFETARAHSNDFSSCLLLVFEASLFKMVEWSQRFFIVYSSADTKNTLFKCWPTTISSTLMFKASLFKMVEWSIGFSSFFFPPVIQNRLFKVFQVTTLRFVSYPIFLNIVQCFSYFTMCTTIFTRKINIQI